MKLIIDKLGQSDEYSIKELKDMLDSHDWSYEIIDEENKMNIKEINENIIAFIEYAFTDEKEKSSLFDSLEDWIKHQKIDMKRIKNER